MSRKPFINALVRRLLRDDLSPGDCAEIGRLIERLQQADQKEKAEAMTSAEEAISNGYRVGDRHAV